MVNEKPSFDERFKAFQLKLREEERQEQMNKRFDGLTPEQIKIKRAKEQIANREALRKGAEGQTPFRKPETQKDFKELKKDIKFTTPGFVPSSKKETPKFVETPDVGKKIKDSRTSEEKEVAKQKAINKIGVKQVFAKDVSSLSSSKQKQFDKNIKGFEETQAEEFKQRALPVVALGLGVATAGIAPAVFTAGSVGAGLLTGGGLVVAGTGAVGTAQQTARAVVRPSVGRFQEKRATQAGFRGLEIERGKKDALGGLISDVVPGTQALGADRQAFVQSATTEFLSQGVGRSKAIREANKLADINLTGGAIGEVGGLVIASGGTEVIGRTGVKFFTQKALAKQSATVGFKGLSKKQAANLITKSAFKGIAPAGFVEGASFEIIQSQAQGKKAKPEDVVFSGLIGAGSAGLLGAGIARTAITRPRTSKFIERGLFVIDPTEKPGDIIGGAVVKNAFDISVPVLTPVFSKSFTQSKTQTFTKSDVKRTRSKGTTFTGIFAPVQSRSSTKTKTPTTNNNPFANANVFTKTDVKKRKSKGTTFTGIFADTKTPTPSNPNPFVPVNPNPNTNTNTDTITPANTLTNTNTNVNVPVPVTVPSGLPPLFGGLPGSGGRRRKDKQRSRIVNELAGVFGGFGSGLQPQRRTPTKRKKTRRRGKKR